MEKRLVLKGIPVSPGTADGKVCIVKSVDELGKIEDDDIVFLPMSHPMYAMAVLKAAAVICEYGGKLSHICIVSLEMGLPCITQVKGVNDVLKDGQHVYVDAGKGEVYLCETI
ncbi:MAG: PEP-utilizing enzyme [Clostridium sp.]|nr:PEP-utilizing enzyme [Clostridium sp.]MCM1398266.1 PEP-utilizing enzyme [Clostridium sp.]MCM1459070.1 PEP-utilizing enzyme [Bacteroides sp.]